MHLHLPNPERLSASTRTAREAFWVAVISLVATFAFFMVIGSIAPSAAAVATVIAGLLLVAYIVHAWWSDRRADGSKDPRLVRARERRGF